MAQPHTRMTLEEFLARPDIDDRRLELIEGEVCEKVSPTWGHGRVAGMFFAKLLPFGYPSVEPRAIVPRSDEHDALSFIPDAAFYLADPPADHDWMRVAPDIVLEVRSPGQSRTELRGKVYYYLDFGARSVWVVDMDRLEVEVYEDGRRAVYVHSDTVRTSVIPELALPVAELFARGAR